MKAGRVRLKPPYRKGEILPEVEINVVFVEEISPPRRRRADHLVAAHQPPRRYLLSKRVLWWNITFADGR